YGLTFEAPDIKAIVPGQEFPDPPEVPLDEGMGVGVGLGEMEQDLIDGFLVTWIADPLEEGNQKADVGIGLEQEGLGGNDGYLVFGQKVGDQSSIFIFAYQHADIRVGMSLGKKCIDRFQDMLAIGCLLFVLFNIQKSHLYQSPGPVAGPLVGILQIEFPVGPVLQDRGQGGEEIIVEFHDPVQTPPIGVQGIQCEPLYEGAMDAL